MAGGLAWRFCDCGVCVCATFRAKTGARQEKSCGSAKQHGYKSGKKRARSDERAYDAPAAGTIRVQIGISDHSEAVLDIHIAEDGLGGIDQPTKREPTAREMDLIASALRGSGYQFNSTLI